MQIDDTNDRVKCPFDHGHSVRKEELARHLKKCNAVKRTNIENEVWFTLDANVLRASEPEIELGEVTFEEFTEWIDYVNKAYSSIAPDSSLSAAELHPVIQLSHECLAPRLVQLSNKKHAIQQSSLIAHLDSAHLLKCNNYYVEFGCGRGELSRYVNHGLMLLHSQSKDTSYKPKFLLIDRDSMRLKLDNKIITDTEDAEISTPQVNRFKTDIKDLDLVAEPRLSSLENSDTQMVAISKHLCGAATDLTIQCLANYSSSSRQANQIPLAGALIALCCRQRCTYSTFPITRLPSSELVTSRGFKILTKMSSWAVCGRRRPTINKELNFTNTQKDAQEGDHQDEEDEGYEADCDGSVNHAPLHASRLHIEAREEIGFKVRALLDHARIMNIRERFDGYDAKLFRYVERGVSYENMALLIVPKGN